MLLLITFFISLYGIFLFMLTISWHSIPVSSDEKDYIGNDFFSIIIPVRNEEDNISTVLSSVLGNNFDKKQYEVLVVNDHSDDNTVAQVDSFIQKEANVNLLQLKHNLQGKKQAIAYAISKAQGNIILCTDGDCEVPENWIKRYAIAFSENPRLMLIFGPVAYKTKRFFDRLLQLELSGLVGIGGSSAQMGMPTMINGANMSYRKEVFEQVGGYSGNEHIPSGDDEFLLRKVHEAYPKGVSFLKDQQAIVKTKPPINFSELLNQRKRWAGKWNSHNGIFSKLLPVFIFLLNILLIVALYEFIFQMQRGFSIIILKLFIDAIFMFTLSRFFNSRFNLFTFLALEIIYPFYVVFFGIASNFGSFIWKNRQF